MARHDQFPVCAGDRRRGRGAAEGSRSGGEIHRRRHQPDRSDEGGCRTPLAADRHFPRCRSRASKRQRAAGCGSARSCRIPISPIIRWSSNAIRCSPARSSPAPRSSCATWHRPAAICCSGRAAAISMTPRRPATNANPAAAARRSTGINRIHAILGASEACIATHPSDMCVALAALDATVHVSGPGGERAIAFADFHRLPGDTPQHDTNLQPNEIITAIELPARGFRGELQLSEDPRPPVLRVRAGLGRGRAGARGRNQHQGRPARARRRRPQAVARSRSRGGAARKDRRARRPSRGRPTCCCATPRASRTTPSRSILRAAPSCAR